MSGAPGAAPLGCLRRRRPDPASDRDPGPGSGPV